MALCHRDGENSIYDYVYAEFSENGEWGLGGGGGGGQRKCPSDSSRAFKQGYAISQKRGRELL